jgi:hypothetical protein
LHVERIEAGGRRCVVVVVVEEEEVEVRWR